MSQSTVNNSSTEGASTNTNGSATNNQDAQGTTPLTDPTVSDADTNSPALAVIDNQPLNPTSLNPGLYAPDPAAPTPANPSIFQIAGQLMNPPESLHFPASHYTLNITWAVGVAGPERFERTALGHRHSVVQTDDLYIHGAAAGISWEILHWLRGGEEELVLPEEHFN